MILGVNKIKGNKFLVRLHGEYNTSLALWKHHANLLLPRFRPVSTDEDPSLRILISTGINTKEDIIIIIKKILI